MYTGKKILYVLRNKDGKFAGETERKPCRVFTTISCAKNTNVYKWHGFREIVPMVIIPKVEYEALVMKGLPRANY